MPFLTVELDPERAAAAAELLAEDEHARVLQGDWADVLPAEAPFDLLFADGGGQAMKTNPAVLDLLAPGGTLVLDNLTPGRAGPDPVRELWLGHPRLAAIELQLSAARGRDRRGASSSRSGLPIEERCRTSGRCCTPSAAPR